MDGARALTLKFDFSTIGRDLLDHKGKPTAEQTRWRIVAKTSRMGIWEYDRDYKNRFFSTEWYELRGQKETPAEEAASHEEWLDSIHPDDQSVARLLTAQFHSGKLKQLNFEYRERHTKGRWVWILARGEAVEWDGDGKPTRFVGTDIDITTVKDAQDANAELREEQLRNQVALNSAEQGVWDVTSNRENIYLSDTWRTLRGYAAHSTYGAFERDWIDDIHPDDVEWTVNNPMHPRHNNQSDEINFQYRQRNADGEWMWILSRGKVVERDGSGKPIRQIGTDTDITDIKHAEHLTARLSRTLGLAIEASQAGVWETDLKTGDAIWDRKTREIFGLTNDQGVVNADTFKSFVHPDDISLVERECDTPARNNEDFSSAYRIIHPTKGVRYLRTNACFQGGDARHRHVGIVWDVTDAQESQRELRNTNAVLDQVVEQMAQGLLVFMGMDFDNATLFMKNQKVVDMLERPGGLPENETTFQDYFEYVSQFIEWPVDGANNPSELMSKLRSDTILRVILRLPNGRIVRTNGSKFGDIGRIVTFTDVTDIFQSEQERISLAESLSHMERLQSVGKLTGGIAHDFNNLLAAIIGNAELLAHELGQENELLTQVLQAAGQGAELTQRLLAFSRKQPLTPQPIDLIPLMESTKKLLQPSIGEDISVHISASPKLWLCIADAGQLQNALINLAVNARDAMPKGGTVQIHATNTTVSPTKSPHKLDLEPGDYVLITVTDNGVGMGEKVALRAFEPFYSTKGIGEGSGLGLSMVYGFVKQSNGDIFIDSSPGTGTSIHIYLPRSEAVIRSDAAQPVKKLTSKEQKITVMLVEDNRPVRLVIETVLKRLGYDILAFEDAAEALEGFQKTDQNISLVLSDIGLPGGMNGIELCSKLKDIDPSLRILNISGYHDGLQHEAKNGDPKFDVLLKPFSIADLSTRLTSILEAPAAE